MASHRPTVSQQEPDAGRRVPVSFLVESRILRHADLRRCDAVCGAACPGTISGWPVVSNMLSIRFSFGCLCAVPGGLVSGCVSSAQTRSTAARPLAVVAWSAWARASSARFRIVASERRSIGTMVSPAAPSPGASPTAASTPPHTPDEAVHLPAGLQETTRRSYGPGWRHRVQPGGHSLRRPRASWR